MRSDTEPLIIRIDRRLDVPTAAGVVERFRSAARERELVLEFAPTVECDMVALSFIAEAIARRGIPVSVRGLSGHDFRILRYLGMPLPGGPEEPLE